MKLVSGIVCVLIFAVSLPSASLTSQDVARVVFYNKALPQPTCVLNETQKAQIISGVEARVLKYINNQYEISNPADASLAVNQIRNASDTECTRQKTLSQQQLTAQTNLNAELKAKLDAYNAANKRTSTTGPGGNTPGTAGGQAASDLSLMQQLVGAAKDARGETDGGKGGKSGERGSGKGTSEGSGTAARANDNSGSTSGGAAGPIAPLPASLVSTSPVASSIQGLIDNANGIVSGKSEFNVVRTANGSQLNMTDRTVSIPGANEGDFITYKYDKTSGKFVSSDGKSAAIAPENLAESVGACTTAECTSAFKDLKADPKTAADAKELTSGGATVPDAEGQAAAQTATTAGQAFYQKILTQSQGLSGTVCALARTPIVTASETYSAQVGSCGNWGGRTDTFCSTIRSPKAKVVQKFMSLGTVIISRTSSASEGCNSAQKFATIAQQGMTVANLACTGLMYSCEFTCGSAVTNLTAVGTAINTSFPVCEAKLKTLFLEAKASCTTGVGCAALIEATRQATSANTAYTAMKTSYAAELNLPTEPSKILAKCATHETDALDMALQILATADATKQAKACKKALGDGNGGGGGTDTTDITMDEFCKVPGQAANPPCKCRTEPTAMGCPGYVANNISNTNETNKANGGGVNTNNTGGVAALAAPGGLSGMQKAQNISGSNLSKEAKEALGVSDSAIVDGDSAAIGFAGSSDSSGSSDHADGASKLGKNYSVDSAKKLDDKKKQNFGDFDFNGMSAGNLKFGPDGKAIINGKKYSQEEIKIMAARKIASEEFFQQVTTASGKSNWDKVRARYDENRGSLYAP